MTHRRHVLKWLSGSSDLQLVPRQGKWTVIGAPCEKEEKGKKKVIWLQSSGNEQSSGPWKEQVWESFHIWEPRLVLSQRRGSIVLVWQVRNKTPVKVNEAPGEQGEAHGFQLQGQTYCCLF